LISPQKPVLVSGAPAVSTVRFAILLLRPVKLVASGAPLTPEIRRITCAMVFLQLNKVFARQTAGE
jgi:hypothetical protein